MPVPCPRQGVELPFSSSAFTIRAAFNDATQTANDSDAQVSLDDNALNPTFGYVNDDDVFHADKIDIQNILTAQSPDIAQGVDARSAEGKETSEGTRISVPLTHEQIAECVGSTRETITRILSEFKNRHLVALRGATGRYG